MHDNESQPQVTPTKIRPSEAVETARRLEIKIQRNTPDEHVQVVKSSACSSCGSSGYPLV